jgi:hypothetical protein
VISLRDLFRAAGIESDGRVTIRFCQHVAMRGRCGRCRAEVAVVRWLADLQTPIGACATCAGPLWPNPFATFSATSLEPLLAVMDQPLAQWGVERFAAIELVRDDRSITFVVGGT